MLLVRWDTPPARSSRPTEPANNSGAGHGQPTMSWADHLTRNVETSWQDGESRSDHETLKRSNDAGTPTYREPGRRGATPAKPFASPQWAPGLVPSGGRPSP